MDKKRTVLVVDDDLHTRDALVAVIERAGIRCIAAANAIEALVALRTEQAQAIVSDHDQALLDAIRRRQPGLVEEIEKRNPSTSVSPWTNAAPY
jgi:DNA-binding NtrC family response regulator